MFKAAHRCTCGSTLEFFEFDEGYPVYQCRTCGILHLSQGCCFELAPKLAGWTGLAD